MPPHPLTNYEIQNYYENETKFNCTYSTSNLSKLKDEVYITNPDEYKSVGSNWISFYVNDDNVTYFGIFRVKHIPKEIKKLIGNKNVITNIYRTQAYDSISNAFLLDLLSSC